MKRYLKVLMLILTASFFVLACQDTSDSSNGSNSGIEDGGSGGNGDGGTGDGGGSSLDSEIINATMRASADNNNALLYTFFSPAAATNGASVVYNWDFDDNAVETTATNLISHEFSKYGKFYNVTLEINNMQTGDTEHTSMVIPLSKPTIYFSCSTTGLDIYCMPNISQQGINDVEYTWNIFNSSNEQIATLTTSGSNQLATYTMPASGTYTITLSAATPKVDGTMEYTESIEVNESLSRGSISYSVLSADKLQYRLRYSAASTTGDILNYCWEIDDEINSGKCESDSNYHSGTAATYDEITYTFPKYKKSYNIKAYVKDSSGTMPAVSSTIINQDLPVVSISATGSGFARQFSPIFTYMPAGNLTYIWSFGDGTQSSEQNPTHTYSSEGYYTVTLEVISDKFDTTIGSIASESFNLNINETISNVTITSSLQAREAAGEKYVLSSSAQSSQDVLNYIWKVDGSIVAQGENISTLEHSFPVYGKSYVVSLEVEEKNTGKKVIAEPKVITTTKPIVKIGLPAYTQPTTQVQIQAKVYFEDTGADFTLAASNPSYEWYVNGMYDSNNTASISKVFDQPQIVPVKLFFSADNIEGKILTAENSINVNNIHFECSVSDDVEDMYGAIVTCNIPTVGEGISEYYYKYSYTEYMNGVPAVIEAPATETTTFKFKLYEEGSSRRYQTRDITLQWYAGTKGQYEYSGSLPLSYTAKEPVMDKVIDIFATEIYASNALAYILTEKGNVYFTGSSSDGNVALTNPRYAYYFPEPISNIYIADSYGFYGGDTNIVFAQANSGNIYVKPSPDDEEKGVIKATGIAGQLQYGVYEDNLYFVVTDNGVYTVDESGNSALILNQPIKEFYTLPIYSYYPGDAYYQGVYLAQDGFAYCLNQTGDKLEPILPNVKFKKMQPVYSDDFGLVTLFAISEDNRIYAILSDDADLSNRVPTIKEITTEGIEAVNNDIVIHNGYFDLNRKRYYIINDKICSFDEINGKFTAESLFQDLSVKKVIGYDNTHSSYNSYSGIFILTTNNELYIYAPVNNLRFGLGHTNPITTPQKLTQYTGVTNVHYIAAYWSTPVYSSYDGSFGGDFTTKNIIETEQGAYEWGSMDYEDAALSYTEPAQYKNPYHILLMQGSFIITDIGLFYKDYDGSYTTTVSVLDFPLGNNPMDNKYCLSHNYILKDNILYYIDGRSKTSTIVNQEYYESTGAQ